MTEPESADARLDKLIESLREHKGQETNNSAGLIASLIAMLVAIVGVAILAFQAWRSGKEKAKLLHESDVAKELEKAEQLDAELSELDEQKQIHLEEVSRLHQQAEELDKKAKEVEHEHYTQIAAIVELLTWEDVDAYIERLSTPAGTDDSE